MAFAEEEQDYTSARRGALLHADAKRDLGVVRPQLPDLLADAGTALVVEDAGLPGGARGPGGRTVFGIPSGWTVNGIPSTPSVSYSRWMELVRLRWTRIFPQMGTFFSNNL